MYPEIFAEIDEILAGGTKEDEPYLPPFIYPNDKSILAPAMEAMKQKVLSDAMPMEHKHPGWLATIKYNANKLR